MSMYQGCTTPTEHSGQRGPRDQSSAAMTVIAGGARVLTDCLSSGRLHDSWPAACVLVDEASQVGIEGLARVDVADVAGPGEPDEFGAGDRAVDLDGDPGWRAGVELAVEKKRG